MAQEQQNDSCGSEADDLSGCVAAVGSGEITSCLNCVSEAIATSSSSSSCQQYNSSFCTSIVRGCSGRCDDNRCGAEFASYYHCEGRRAYGNLNSSSVVDGGSCEIECGEIDGNSTAGGVSGNGTLGGGGTVELWGACNTTWTTLQQCLAGQGRSEQSRTACASCIAGSIPPPPSSSGGGVCSSSLDQQFCTAASGCDDLCAQPVCGESYGHHVWCAGTAATGCLKLSCGINPTTSAAVAAGMAKATTATLLLLVVKAATVAAGSIF